MLKVLKTFYQILVVSFLISVICGIIALLSAEGSLLYLVSGSIFFYGSIITINLFFLHVLLTLAHFIRERIR